MDVRFNTNSPSSEVTYSFDPFTYREIIERYGFSREGRERLINDLCECRRRRASLFNLPNSDAYREKLESIHEPLQLMALAAQIWS